MTSPSPRLGAISKPLLADAVHDRLLESLVRGELRVGERVNVDSLAGSFGVSRTPVREALVRLSHARFVEISRNSSTVVAQWGCADMCARARMIGDVARGVVLVRESDLTGLGVVTGGGAFEQFIATARAITERSTSPLPGRIVDELGAPLSIYCSATDAGIEAAARSRHRIESALGHLAETLAPGDTGARRARVAEAVNALTAAATEAVARHGRVSKRA